MADPGTPGQTVRSICLLWVHGGGIRGLSELITLHELMESLMHEKGLSQRPRPCDYFHLIGGTSTGGLIALLLGRFRLDTEEALRIYNSCAKSIFSKQNTKGTFKDGSFKASTLVRKIQQTTEEQQMGDRMIDTKSKTDMGRCFVCAMPAKDMTHPEHFRSYQVKKNNSANCEIWEAARATTAAPTFFKRIAIGEDGHQKIEYIDGGLRCNNPTEETLREARQVFGDERLLNCLLSIGTGLSKVIGLAKPDLFQRVIPKKLIDALEEIALDCEETSHKLAQRFDRDEHLYFRFNVARGLADVSLEEWEKMEQVEISTKQYLKEVEVSQKLDRVVKLLCQPRQNARTLGSIAGVAPNLPAEVPHEPAYFDIPPSPIFTGREKILSSLTQFFLPRSTLVREYLLWGMGGVGKSQVALKFANDQRDHYDYIYWIDASTSTTIDQSFTAVTDGQSLDVPNHSSTAQIATAWLAKTQADVLLIFDNVDKYSSVQSAVPQGGRVDVIHTSRNREMQLHIADGCSQEVSVMCSEEALMLLTRARRLDSQPVGVELQAVRNIVSALGALPLALDQAGAYMFTRACSAEEYYELFSGQRKSLMERADYRSASPQKQAVYATWEISHQYLERKVEDESLPRDERQVSLLASGLLGIFSNLHHENIPKEMLIRAAKNVPIPIDSPEDQSQMMPSFVISDTSKLSELLDSDETNSTTVLTDNNSSAKTADSTSGPILAAYAYLLPQDANVRKAMLHPLVQEATRELMNLSLLHVTHNGKSFSMHTLVHSWAKDRLTTDLRRVSRLTTMMLIHRSIPESVITRDDWQIRRLLIPHITASDYATVITNEFTCFIAMELASVLRVTNSQIEIAEKLLVRAFQVLKDSSSPASDLSFQCLLDLYRTKPNPERWREIREVVEERGDTQELFGAIHAMSSTWDESEDHRGVQLGEEILRSILSDDSNPPQHLAFAHGVLGKILLFQKRYEDIIKLLKPVLDSPMNQEDSRFFWTRLFCCECLGRAYLHFHRFEELEDCLDRFQSHYSKLGRGKSLNPTSLTSLNWLRSQNSRLRGKYTEALESFMAYQEAAAAVPEQDQPSPRATAREERQLRIVLALPPSCRAGFELFSRDWESTNESSISFTYGMSTSSVSLGVVRSGNEDHQQLAWGSQNSALDIALRYKDKSSASPNIDEDLKDLQSSLTLFALRLSDDDIFVSILRDIIKFRNLCVDLGGTHVPLNRGRVDLLYQLSSKSTLFYFIDAQSKPEEAAFFRCSIIWVEEDPEPKSSRSILTKDFKKLKEMQPHSLENERASEEGVYFGLLEGVLVLFDEVQSRR